MRAAASGAGRRLAGPFAAWILLTAALTGCTTNTCGGDRGGSTVCVNNGAAPDADVQYKQQVVAASCSRKRTPSRRQTELLLARVSDRGVLADRQHYLGELSDLDAEVAHRVRVCRRTLSEHAAR
ncbi:hypothetical protein ACTVZO_34910 [Streptomyces sp. IBSNAI002]|uniref:hypothetical protein n=1 Tax=Streptomyces sp. IBSNAI002 TaxID=3457500 RepID=UPI003FD30605